jgi:uncharacterized protein YecA (UPF0149 family)
MAARKSEQLGLRRSGATDRGGSMAKLVRVYNQERPGHESFEFTLSTEEQELIRKEVGSPQHVLDWVRHPRGEGGVYRLQAEQLTELYETIESVAYMDDKRPTTQEALQRLVACLETMVESFYSDEAYDERATAFLRAQPTQPCPCGSGRKYLECCGRTC